MQYIYFTVSLLANAGSGPGVAFGADGVEGGADQLSACAIKALSGITWTSQHL